MMNTTIQFRNITLRDVSKVKEITKNIWEGYDYVAKVIPTWLARKEFFVYGAFYNNDLAGLGCIWRITKTFSWLQGVRVDPNLQRKGVGRALFQFGVNYSIKHGAKKIQFATGTTNQASLKLGAELGFQRKDKMAVLWLKTNDFIERKSPNSEKIAKISPTEGLDHINLERNDNVEEICVGWAYIPVESPYLERETGNWYKCNHTVLIEASEYPEPIKESPNENIWAIMYGKEDDAEKILRERIQAYKKSQIPGVDLFCPENIVPVAQKLGFRYWDDIPIGVVLLERNIQ